MLRVVERGRESRLTTKERLHQLLDELPENELPAVERVFEDPLVRALLNTPEGEDPLTPEEIAGLLEAQREVAAGKAYRFSDVRAAIQWPRHGPPPDDS